ncbi:hypothetical protein Tco_0563176, partial [Tanacetum coccineum]
GKGLLISGRSYASGFAQSSVSVGARKGFSILASGAGCAESSAFLSKVCSTSSEPISKNVSSTSSFADLDFLDLDGFD